MISIIDPLNKEPTREEFLKYIVRSSQYGNLGLFVGAGFTKAVLENSSNKPLSWCELIKKTSADLGIKYESIEKEGLDFPQIASKICKQYSTEKGIPYNLAIKEFKENIASNTCWYLDMNDHTNKKWALSLRKINPAWIITTNYDLVIDSLLTGKSISLTPQDMLVSNRDIIPIYHLHGIRTDPSSIIILKEDYISLFRPYEYRQTKLTLTLKESTTLVLGYRFGDINISTAMDWMRNLFADKNIDHPHEVIQIIRGSEKLPYKDPATDIWVLEVESIEKFFREYTLNYRNIKNKNKELSEKFKKMLKMFSKDSFQDKFIQDGEFRKTLLSLINSTETELIISFLKCLDGCLNKIDNSRKINGAFEEYNKWLSILLDILTGFEFKNIPPVLLFLTAGSLNKLAPYIGSSLGESYAADNTWKAKKTTISPEIIQELSNIAKQYEYKNLENLLKKS